MTKDEALKIALRALKLWHNAGEVPSWYGRQDRVDAITALRQALDQSPDTTKMIDTGIDRGAWSDVPDATKWVDELRGDDDLEEPPNSTTSVVDPVYQISLLKSSVSTAWIDVDKHTYDDAGLYAEYGRRVMYTAPPKDIVEPIGEIVEAHGLIAVSIPEMPPVGTKLYTAPPKPCVNRGLMEALKQIADETYDEWTNGAKAQRIAEAAIKAALKEKNHD